MINTGQRALAGDTVTVAFQAYDASTPPVELTGATDLQFAAYRRSDGLWYDFNDDTFKAKGSVTTLHKALSEKDATDAPGVYEASWDLSAITNHAAAPDTFVVQLSETTGSDLGFVQAGELLVNPMDMLAAVYDGAIWIDTAGTAGSTLGVHGTRANPCTLWADAVTLANAYGTHRFYVHGDVAALTIGTDFQGALIQGYGGGGYPSIQVSSGTDISYSEFRGCNVASTSYFNTSTLVRFSECMVGVCNDIVHNRLWRCIVYGKQTLDDTGSARIEMLDCSLLGLSDGFPIYISGPAFAATTFVQVAGCSGAIGLEYMRGSSDVVIGMTDGAITIDSSCTAGSADLYGLAELNDSSGAGFSVDTGGLQQPGVAAVSAAAIADAVWDEALAAHTTSDSPAVALRMLKAFALGNYTLDNITYDANGYMTTGRLRLWDSSTNVPSSGGGSESTGLLATITVTGTADTSFPTMPSFVRGSMVEV